MDYQMISAGDHLDMSLLPFYGEGHVLWASDSPHPDTNLGYDDGGRLVAAGSTDETVIRRR